MDQQKRRVARVDICFIRVCSLLHENVTLCLFSFHLCSQCITRFVLLFHFVLGLFAARLGRDNKDELEGPQAVCSPELGNGRC